MDGDALGLEVGDGLGEALLEGVDVGFGVGDALLVGVDVGFGVGAIPMYFQTSFLPDFLH